MDNLIYKKKTQSINTFDGKQSELPSETLPNSVLESIARGSSAPTSAMLGHRENLSPSLQTKMQGAFGADFSNLELYRSDTARDAGLLGVASGNKVALSPDIDLNSHTGQAVLGHELSHVVAQAQGIGATGRGIMETPSLERQAMIEGERAASGMRAFAGSGLSMDSTPTFSERVSTMGSETLTPISATTGAFGMGAPMQGKKDDDNIDPADYNNLSEDDQAAERLGSNQLLSELQDESIGAQDEQSKNYYRLMLAMREEVEKSRRPNPYDVPAIHRIIERH